MYEDDESENSENYEAAPQADESNVQEMTAQEEDQAKEQSKQDRNWREMRRKQDALQKEIEKRDQMLDMLLQKQNQANVQVQVEEEEFPDEEYASGMHVKKIATKAVKPLEQKIADLEKKIAQQEQDKLISNLRSKYSDFDDVVNIETLEILEQREPELAATIASVKDPYKMGMQSYKYIKALGLDQDIGSHRRVKEVNKKIEQNKKTVQSPMAHNKRPMAQAMRMSESDKNGLYEEMMMYAQGSSSL